MREADLNRMSEEEIGRLANRMAMLVSDDGEADNAGRAVGALARRLGLSGGQLKAIFMAGAQSAGVQTARLAEQAARIVRLEAETEQLRTSLRAAEAAMHTAQRERDALSQEADELHAALDERRTGRRIRLVLGLILVLAAGGGVWLAVNLPALHVGPRNTAEGTPFYRSALVHERATVMHREPDQASPAVLTLTEGTHLAVRRTLWHNLMQWVEVEIGGQSGYVMSSDVDLS
jgi:hypothetical protein